MRDACQTEVDSLHSWALVFQYSRPNRPYKRAKNKNMLTSRHIMKGPRRFHFQLTSVAQLLPGVYIRKLAPARVSYPDEFFISYRVYIMTGSFHISLVEGTLHVYKIHVRFKIANMRMRYPFQSTSRLISHRNLWSFNVCEISHRSEIVAPVQQLG